MQSNQTGARESYIRLIESQREIARRYSRIARIGATAGDGHFSLLFSAEDSATKKRVALKFYDPTRIEAYRLSCFDREVENLGKFIGKPNILQLIEGKRELIIPMLSPEGEPVPFPPLPYFVVELARKDLRKVIYSDEFNATDALFFFKEACKAVQRLHASGICHRDLKPSNFLLFNRRELKSELVKHIETAPFGN